MEIVFVLNVVDGCMFPPISSTGNTDDIEEEAPSAVCGDDACQGSVGLVMAAPLLPCTARPSAATSTCTLRHRASYRSES
jgi:hypothetical protein